jgi:Metallo-beta-lactamase superfamily
MKIKILKAFNGDCILLTFCDEEQVVRNILIDSGIGETYLTTKNSKGKREFGELKSVIEKIKDDRQKIDLLVLTHIDDDHIGGILKWFQQDKEAYKLITEVWFNSGEFIAESIELSKTIELEVAFDYNTSKKTSIMQGKSFAKYIAEKNIGFKELICQGNILKRFGLEFKILSPDKFKLEKLLKEWNKKAPDLKTAVKEHDYKISIKEHIENDDYNEDMAVGNGSSIAFIICFGDDNILFLGDAHPSVVVSGLNMFGCSPSKKIVCKLVKISHHGSAGNTSSELLKCIECNDFIISTNGNGHHHPHKQMLSRLISENPYCTIWFNYRHRMEMIFSKSDRIKYENFKITEIKKDFEF